VKRVACRYPSAVAILHPTPRDKMLDAKGRPYFLWDVDMTLEEFEGLLRDPSPTMRSLALAKLMRQAKPDDVFTFVTRREIRELWPDLRNRLGRTRDLWEWLLGEWDRMDGVG